MPISCSPFSFFTRYEPPHPITLPAKRTFLTWSRSGFFLRRRRRLTIRACPHCAQASFLPFSQSWLWPRSSCVGSRLPCRPRRPHPTNTLNMSRLSVGLFAKNQTPLKHSNHVHGLDLAHLTGIPRQLISTPPQSTCSFWKLQTLLRVCFVPIKPASSQLGATLMLILMALKYLRAGASKKR